MARKSKGFIELEWTCPNCETRNRGSLKTCVNCGAPQPEDVQFEAPAKSEFVSEEKASELRQRGADIHCAFCGARNPSTAEVCSQCGADLKEGKRRASGQEIERPSGPQTVVCENCGTKNPAEKVNCVQCGSALPRVTPPAQPVPALASAAASKPGGASAKPAKKRNWLLIGGIAGALLVCCAAIIFLFFLPTSSITATVSDVYWQTSVPVQEIRAVDYSHESGSPPSDAYNVSCHDETQQVCEEKTIDRGNGYAEVVQDCKDETTQYCDYTRDEWKTVQTYTLDGRDYSPVYSQPSLTSDQRLGDQSADYTVYFDTEKGQKTYSPGSLSEFGTFQIGSSWTLKLNALGGVVGVQK